ncbi:hypothetical protein GQ457_06G017940 [Hibiscus cannabinus]
MAKKGKTPETGEKTELKQELQRLLKVILEEDECSVDMAINSIGILSRLTEMKLNQSVELGVALPKVDHDMDVPMPDQCPVNSLLEKLSSSLSDQREAAKELHRLTKTIPSCRAIFSEIPDGISRLLKPLRVAEVDSDPELQEDLMATILNISSDDNNKKLVAEHPVVLRLLAESMKSGTIVTRRNSAAAVFTLSTLHSNKRVIGDSHALGSLVQLLRVGHPLAVKDAVSAIFSLCQVNENIANFTERGAVKIIIHKLNAGILVDELLDILVLLSQHQDAVDILKDPPTVQQFHEFIRINQSEHAKKAVNTILDNHLQKMNFKGPKEGRLQRMLLEEINPKGKATSSIINSLDRFTGGPKLGTAKDFFLGLNIPKNTSNSVGSVVTPVNVDQIQGLNTLDISLVRIDYARNGGLNPLHTHPAIKILQNVGKTNAVAFAGLSSQTQNPGVIAIPNAVFGSILPIKADVLTMAFQMNE